MHRLHRSAWSHPRFVNVAIDVETFGQRRTQRDKRSVIARRYSRVGGWLRARNQHYLQLWRPAA